jgi:hypothetical protein
MPSPSKNFIYRNWTADENNILNFLVCRPFKYGIREQGGNESFRFRGLAKISRIIFFTFRENENFRENFGKNASQQKAS